MTVTSSIEHSLKHDLMDGTTPEFRALFQTTEKELLAELSRFMFHKTLRPEHFYAVSSIRIDGFSSLIWEGVAQIQFSPLQNGNFLVRKTIFARPSSSVISSLSNSINSTANHLYDWRGNLIEEATFDPESYLLLVDLTDMEPNCAITSHLYNILAYEYGRASTGDASSNRITLTEMILESSVNQGKERFSWYRTPEDAIEKIHSQMSYNETDPALTFQEKSVVRTKLKAERRKILTTKKRVHNGIPVGHHIHPFRKDIGSQIDGWRARPREKVNGFFYRYTIGVILWFCSVVRKNIGYSVALAIYAPFTYYFITQPMNPGAMWAVGEVRKVFLASMEWTKVDPGKGNAPAAVVPKTEAGNLGSSPETQLSPLSLPESPNSFENEYASVKPRFEGMILGTDVPSVDLQSWTDRMSHFKAMQISYESNLQFSQRMGRLEQMELQLNFALITEATYRELEAYADTLDRLRKLLILKNLYGSEATTYLDGESSRLKQFKLYLWDKMVRYMLDHPYVVLNESKEQVYVDYYVGRNFMFLEEMTKNLTSEYSGFKKPKGFKAIEDLSKFYSEKKISAPTLQERLVKNSIVHQLSNPKNSVELRERLKRQWEVLFLSYNRAQEPANFGLQLYVWSVRNAIWSMGALVTAKSRELDAVMLALQNPNESEAALDLKKAQIKIEPLVESLFHILSLEFLSIREELGRKLENDLDSVQRQVLIDGIEKSFPERTNFLRKLPLGQ